MTSVYAHKATRRCRSSGLPEPAFCAAVALSESEYEGTESEAGSELEKDSKVESEQSPEERPCLTGVMPFSSTEGMSRHDGPSSV